MKTQPPLSSSFVIFPLLLVLFATIVLAAEPTTIALQGKLTNTTTGSLIYSATLRVNVSDANGITVWNQTYPNAVSSGFFDLLLGADGSNPLNLTFNKEYNVSVYIGESSVPIGGSYKFRSSMGSVSVSNITSGNFSAEGNYSFGSTLFVDKTNGYVGIGTTEPGAKLTIAGDQVPIRFENTGGVANEKYWDVYPQTNGVAGGILHFRALNDAKNAEGTWLDVYRNPGLQTINKIVFAPDGGNVGIGTTSPATLLHLSSSSPLITINDTDTPQYFTIGGAGDDFGIYLNGTNTKGITINEGGNIGIGTTAPESKLHVGGNVQANGFWIASGAGDTLIGGTAAGNTIVFNTSGAERMRIDNNGYIGIGTTTPTSKLHINGGNINVSGNSAYIHLEDDVGGLGTRIGSDTSGNGLLQLYNQGNEKLRIYAHPTISEFWWMGGNVGIGTTSPAFNLEINEDAPGGSVDLLVKNTNLTSSTANTRIMSYVESVNSGDPKIGVGITGIRDYFWYIDNSDSDKLKLETSSVDLLTVDNTGNVGIGTASPGTYGKLEVQQSTDADEGGISIANIGINRTMRLWVGADKTSRIESGDGGIGNLILNSGAGNVGIGTTEPGAKLEVKHSSSVGVFSNGTGSNFVAVADTLGIFGHYRGQRNGTIRYYLGLDASDNFAVLNSDASVAMVVDTDGNTGNVGIGTTAPGSKLFVDPGSQTVLGQVSDSGIHIGRAVTNALNEVSQITLGYPNANSPTAIAALTTSATEYGYADLIFATRSVTTDSTPTERMRITAGGDICDPGTDSDLTDCASDIKLKENIKPYKYGLKEIVQLKPVQFNWNEKAEELGYNRDLIVTGMIAQEVEKVIPEWVTINENGYKKIDGSGNLNYVLINAIKEQQSQIGQLEEENSALKLLICLDHPTAEICRR